jgi:hypothetical protein
VNGTAGNWQNVGGRAADIDQQPRLAPLGDIAPGGVPIGRDDPLRLRLGLGGCEEARLAP